MRLHHTVTRRLLAVGLAAGMLTAFAPAPEQATPEPVAAAPAPSHSYIESGGDTVFAVAEGFGKRAFRVTAANGTAMLSRDGGATFVPSTLPVEAEGTEAFGSKSVVHDVEVDNEGRVYVAGRSIWRLDGDTWVELPGFRTQGASIFGLVEVTPDGTIHALLESYFSCAGTHELLVSTDGGETSRSVPLPADGVYPTDMTIDDDGRVAMLVRFPYILNDHDCYTSDAPAGQFVARAGVWDWRSVDTPGEYASDAVWADGDLVLALGDGEETNFNGTEVAVFRNGAEVDRTRIDDLGLDTPALRDEDRVRGLAFGDGELAVHTGRALVEYPLDDGRIGDGTLLVEHLEETGLLWFSEGDRPVAVTPTGLFARDLTTVYRIN